MTAKIEKLVDFSSRVKDVMDRIQYIDEAIEDHKKQKGEDRCLLNIERGGYGYDPVRRLSNTELRTKMTDYFLRVIRKEKRELQAELETLTKKLK